MVIFHGYVSHNQMVIYIYVYIYNIMQYYMNYMILKHITPYRQIGLYRSLDYSWWSINLHNLQAVDGQNLGTQ